MSSTATAQSEPEIVSMRSIIQRIATGPELSKDITRDEACAGMRMILNGEVDPVQAGIFLIALRMKRETDEENLGVLDAVLEATDSVTADVDEVADIADPYDGYNRTLSPSPFLPAVLAACGMPAVCHGVESMGPKYGVTNRQVLRAAGAPVDLTPQQAAARIAEPDVGWAYVDQEAFCPGLHNLKDLRTLIVKRPAITTVEVLAKPVCGRGKTHLITGYVHKPYPRIYAMLARSAGFDSTLLIRGVEGGVIPSLRQAGKIVFYHDGGEEQPADVDPKALAIEQDIRAVSIPDDLPRAADKGDGIATGADVAAAAQATVEMGLDALKGQSGAFRDGLVYAGALCLHHLQRCGSMAEAADTVRAALDSGAVLARVAE